MHFTPLRELITYPKGRKKEKKRKEKGEYFGNTSALCVYSNIGEKDKIRATPLVPPAHSTVPPQLTRFRSHEGAVVLVIYMRITFFYTRVTYLHRAQVCLMRHTDIRERQSFRPRNRRRT